MIQISYRLHQLSVEFYVFGEGGSGIMINLGTQLATMFLAKMFNLCISLCSLQEITPFMNALTQILLAHRQQQSGSTLANLLTDTSPDTESPSQ